MGVYYDAKRSTKQKVYRWICYESCGVFRQSETAGDPRGLNCYLPRRRV